MNEPGALVRSARSGDPEAFTDLVRGCDERMRRLAVRLLGNQAAMDDALQDAYVKAYRAIDTFEGNAQFATWLYRIVYRTCLDHLRSANRRPDQLQLVDVATGPDPSERVVLIDELHRAVASLPPDQAAAVVLVDVDGLSYGEAATVLEVSEGTIASRLSRARDALRTALDCDTDRRTNP